MVCNPEDFEIPLKGTPLDYSNKDNWMRFGYTSAGKKQDVDVFYLYPTSADPKVQDIVNDVDDYMRASALYNYRIASDSFESFTNVYAPFYRQLSYKGIAIDASMDGFLEVVRKEVVRTDAYAAIDYYFENCNEGRPFILVSHSQGASVMKLILSEYMRMPEHRKYMDRMIAAYLPGFLITNKWLDDNDLKAAKGETDTGVIITWNTYADGSNALMHDDDGIGINPVNWTVDGTPADRSQHLGAKLVDPKSSKEEIIPKHLSATQDPKYQCIVRIKTDTEIFHPLPENSTYGSGSYHLFDWSLFYVDVAENAKKRIDAYLKKN